MNTNTPPETPTGNLVVKEQFDDAAGVMAIYQSFKHTLDGTGLGRGSKALFKLNQKDGFDCPSCAWPDPDHHRSPIAEYCESGAKAVADEIMTHHTASPVLFQRYTIDELLRKTDFWLGQQGRITQPMMLRPGSQHYVPVSWDEAITTIADQLNELDTPDEAVFYTSGRASNESAFLYQLFVRMFGTNNMPDCSNMCHESTSVALAATLGLGKASVTYEDYAKADVIMIMGQNPGTNSPRMLTVLEEAKQNGAKIISVNPIHEIGLIKFKNPQSPRDMVLGGEKLTDLYLQVRINSDMALLKAMCMILLEEEEKTPGEVLDRDFIDTYTSGFDAFKKGLSQFSLYEMSVQCGVPLEQIREAVAMFRNTRKLIICWAMGLTQHRDSVDTLNELVNLLLLKGSIGIEGGGASPIRGHSNVQGDRTVGVWEKPKPEFLDSLKKAYNFEPPRHNGFDVVKSVKAMHDGKIKTFFGLGGNFVLAVSDTDFTAEAMRKLKLTVHVSTKINRSHLIHGETAIILPCLGRTDRDHQATGEQFVSCESTTGVVAQSHGVVDAVSNDLKSEVAILGALAKATLSNTSSHARRNLPPLPHEATTAKFWDDFVGNYDLIRDGIDKVVPGFENYNERVRVPGGFYIPNGPRVREFKTENGKAHFTVTVPDTHSLQPGELMMMSIRAHDQFNTTIYGYDDRYRGVYGERRVIFMNKDDIANLGLYDQQLVDLHSTYYGKVRTAHKFFIVPYNIPRGCVATYYPETNVLIPIDQVAEKSNTPTSKSIIITVTPAEVLETAA